MSRVLEGISTFDWVCLLRYRSEASNDIEGYQSSCMAKIINEWHLSLTPPLR